jgi:hypothetical protein
MSDLQSDLNRVVSSFVAQITDLARRAAIDTLEGALGKRGGGGGGLSARGARRGRGAKRTAGELDKLGDRFHDYVAKHPGLRIEQINSELGTSTKDLALPIRKMIADGSLKTKGAKRSTTYFAGSKKKAN